jgi:pyruvate/2-oxoglutarate dehydrogenase complex dihydrolipoamide dehydrogenase (E3) component
MSTARRSFTHALVGCWDGIWTSREVTGMKAVSRRLLVLGGGPVGVEMAQALTRLGAEVTIVEASEARLP